jgi:hypothetical protein
MLFVCLLFPYITFGLRKHISFLSVTRRKIHIFLIVVSSAMNYTVLLFYIANNYVKSTWMTPSICRKDRKYIEICVYDWRANRVCTQTNTFLIHVVVNIFLSLIYVNVSIPVVSNYYVLIVLVLLKFLFFYQCTKVSFIKYTL